MLSEKYFKNQRVMICKGAFAILNSSKEFPDAFAVIKDKNESTIVIEESKLKENNFEEIQKGYKLLTFDVVLPFGLVGFIAKISNALAEDKISIFVISAYSTDHILVKNKDLDKAKKKLEGMGFIIIDN